MEFKACDRLFIMTYSTSNTPIIDDIESTTQRILYQKGNYKSFKVGSAKNFWMLSDIGYHHNKLPLKIPFVIVVGHQAFNAGVIELRKMGRNVMVTDAKFDILKYLRDSAQPTILNEVKNLSSVKTIKLQKDVGHLKKESETIVLLLNLDTNQENQELLSKFRETFVGLKLYIYIFCLTTFRNEYVKDIPHPIEIRYTSDVSEQMEKTSSADTVLALYAGILHAKFRTSILFFVVSPDESGFSSDFTHHFLDQNDLSREVVVGKNLAAFFQFVNPEL